MWSPVDFHHVLMDFDISRWQKLQREWCNRALLLPAQRQGFKGAFWAAKVTFHYMCLEDTMNYFVVYELLSESKEILMGHIALLRKSNKVRQMHSLAWKQLGSGQMAQSFTAWTVVGSAAQCQWHWEAREVNPIQQKQSTPAEWLPLSGVCMQMCCMIQLKVYRQYFAISLFIYFLTLQLWKIL